MQNTFLRLKKWLSTALDVPEDLITSASTLDDLFWEKRGTPPDSMDIVELMMAMETEFEISEDDLENMPSSQFILGNTTVQQIADLIDKQAQK